MDKFSRAQRRHDSARLFRRCYRKMHQWGCFEHFDAKETHKFVRRHQNNMAICSCWMCGNPRRGAFSYKEKITMQERKAAEYFKASWEAHLDESEY